MASSPSFFTALKRGLGGRCPHCGDGKLFYKYLKVNAECPACGLDLARYPADDGPAYFTILIVGHLVVAPLLFFPIVWQASPFLMVPATLIPLTVITMILLPRIKGAFIGVLYRTGVKDTDAHLHTTDYAE